jgi:hypothetical protein
MGTNKSGMWAVWCVVLACVICFGGCGGASAGSVQGSKHVQVNVNEPETLDFQHTTIGYTVPYATFDRLVGGFEGCRGCDRALPRRFLGGL